MTVAWVCALSCGFGRPVRRCDVEAGVLFFAPRADLNRSRGETESGRTSSVKKFLQCCAPREYPGRETPDSSIRPAAPIAARKHRRDLATLPGDHEGRKTPMKSAAQSASKNVARASGRRRGHQGRSFFGGRQMNLSPGNGRRIIRRKKRGVNSCQNNVLTGGH